MSAIVKTGLINGDEPAVYVGTYAKYNEGSIEGAWLCLDDYSDRDEFIEACLELHKDESDPELMFQDYQCFPSGFYDECEIDELYWELTALDSYDRELVEAYLDHHGLDYESSTLEQAQHSLVGTGSSFADVLHQYAIDCDLLRNVPDSIIYCIDWDLWGRDEFSSSRFNGEEWVWSD